jgi:uncharacterized membrane protein YebE (DUF533 family)
MAGGVAVIAAEAGTVASTTVMSTMTPVVLSAVATPILIVASVATIGFFGYKAYRWWNDAA